MRVSRDTFTDKGLVLKSSPYGESDALITLLLSERGKLTVLAKGIKRSKKRFMGGLDLFHSGLFSIEYSGNRMPILTGVSERRTFDGIGANLRAFTAASVALEVTSHLCLDQDPEGGLYLEILLACLAQLVETPPLAPTVRYLVQLLTASGFSEFESLTSSHPEVSRFLQEAAEPPRDELLAQLLRELLRSVEIILGRQLATRQTAERFLLLGH